MNIGQIAKMAQQMQTQMAQAQEELKETTLDPRTRSLLRVDIDNFVNADATFAQLLGKDPAERYRVIMEEAADVDDLDV